MPRDLSPIPRWQDTDIADDLEAQSLWLFAYGSLIWRPDFMPLAKKRATLNNYSRRLCIHSYRYRGTLQHPGLVYGLVPSNKACQGVALQIPIDARDEILTTLWQRELLGSAYIPSFVDLAVENQAPLRGLTFVVNKSCDQYAGEQNTISQLAIVQNAHGGMGSNLDYVLNTAKALQANDIQDLEIQAMSAVLLQQANLQG